MQRLLRDLTDKGESFNPHNLLIIDDPNRQAIAPLFQALENALQGSALHWQGPVLDDQTALFHL